LEKQAKRTDTGRSILLHKRKLVVSSTFELPLSTHLVSEIFSAYAARFAFEILAINYTIQEPFNLHTENSLALTVPTSSIHQAFSPTLSFFPSSQRRAFRAEESITIPSFSKAAR
jgi:hypothetical protein